MLLILLLLACSEPEATGTRGKPLNEKKTSEFRVGDKTFLFAKDGTVRLITPGSEKELSYVDFVGSIIDGLSLEEAKLELEGLKKFAISSPEGTIDLIWMAESIKIAYNSYRRSKLEPKLLRVYENDPSVGNAIELGHISYVPHTGEIVKITLSTPLSHATQEGVDEVYSKFHKQLLAQDDLVAYDENGVTALHRAVSGGDVDEVRRVLDSGLDVNVRSYNSQHTALHQAVHELGVTRDLERAKRIIKLLRERGADIYLLDRNYETPIEYLHYLTEYLKVPFDEELINYLF